MHVGKVNCVVSHFNLKTKYLMCAWNSWEADYYLFTLWGLNTTVKSRLSLIVRVNVVLNRIVVVDSDSVQDYVHPDDQTLSTFEMTPGFKPFTVITINSLCYQSC